MPSRIRVWINDFAVGGEPLTARLRSGSRKAGELGVTPTARRRAKVDPVELDPRVGSMIAR